jgi:hypothetical protein
MEKILQILKRALLFLLKTMWIFALIVLIIFKIFPNIYGLSFEMILIVTVVILAFIYFILFVLYSLVCKEYKKAIISLFIFFIIVLFLLCISPLPRRFSSLVRWYYNVTWSCPYWYDLRESIDGSFCEWNIKIKLSDSIFYNIYTKIIWKCPFGYDYESGWSGDFCVSSERIELLDRDDYENLVANKQCKEWWWNLSKDGDFYVCSLKDWAYRKFERAIGVFDYVEVDKQWNETKYICSGWYDGCNSCGRGGICTQRFCSNYGPSKCDSWISEEELKRTCHGLSCYF